MTPTPIRLTMGLRCKACNSSLGTADFDPELCAPCYIASTGLFAEPKDDDLLFIEVDEDYVPPIKGEEW